MAKKKMKTMQGQAPKDTEVHSPTQVEEKELLKRYTVELPFLPPMEVEAASKKEAVVAYNKLLGIIDTIHKHKVSLL